MLNEDKNQGGDNKKVGKIYEMKKPGLRGKLTSQKIQYDFDWPVIKNMPALCPGRSQDAAGDYFRQIAKRCYLPVLNNLGQIIQNKSVRQGIAVKQENNNGQADEDKIFFLCFN